MRVKIDNLRFHHPQRLRNVLSFYLTAILALLTLVVIPNAYAQSPDVFPIPTSGVGPTRPAVADLDRNPANGKEIVVTTTDGHLHALSASGAILWSASTPNQSCTSAPASDKLYSSPVVGDLFGTGELYVIVGYGGFRGKPCDGGVAAYRGSTGELVWKFSVKEWSQKQRFFAFRHAVYGTPSLADVDGDGKLEVGFGSFDRNVYLLNSNGSVRWYYNAADTVFSTPAFANVGGDSKLEMLIGTDISKNTRIRPPTRNGGYLYAFKAGVSVPPGKKFLFRSHEIQLWRASFPQVIQASPIIADIIPSAPGLEVVTGTGCFFPQGAGQKKGKFYKVLSAASGRVLKTLRVTACTPTTPAVGDVDGDGVNEVVVSVSGSSAAGGDGTSHLIAWKPSADSVLWDIRPRIGTRFDAMGGHYNRVPVIADINQDGIAEVLVSHHTGIVIVSGPTGTQLSCDSSPCAKPLLKGDSAMQGSPAVSDTNGDGILEILALGRSGGTNAVLRWRNPL